MRLHRIELTGFGPFREPQRVDFDAFLGEGIFLISGRTGAGKSSILDGVVFALYGSVPRYDGGEKRLRSDHCEPGDPTQVRLEFTVADRRWRVTRAPEYERPAKRGGGLTTEVARAELEEEVDGVWVGRASRPRDVALLLDEILGLNQSQFQQVILLAQNKFSRFLLAGNADRQALLRTLFDSRRFEQYRDALDARKRDAQAEVEAAGAQVRTLLAVAERLIAEGGDELDGTHADGAPAADGTVADRIAAAEHALQRVAYQAEVRAQERLQADAAHTAAAAEHARVTALAKAHDDLVRARSALEALEADAAAVAADDARLARAREAETLRAVLAAVARTDADAVTAADAAATADAAWSELRPDPAADPREVDDQLTGDLAVWAAALTQERGLPDLAAEAEAAEAQIASLTATIEQLQTLGAELPDEIAALDARIAERALAAAVEADALAATERLQQQRAAAAAAAALAERSAAADDAYRQAAEASQTASGTVATLLRRRLDGYAGELAAALVPGEECAVCGSTTHPHPAPGGADPVTDEQFAAAEAARDRAVDAERAARDAAAAVRDELAAAAAGAGGATVAVVDEELAAAQARLDAARAAAADHGLLVAARTELVERQAQLTTSLSASIASRASAGERAARAQERLEAARRAVAAARGDHASVAERIAAATAVRDAARAVVAAREQAARTATARAEARARADEALAASAFDRDDEVQDAFLDQPEQQRLADRVAAHAADLAATRQRLLELELELAGTGGEPVDLASAEEALGLADTVRAAAIAAEEAARGRVAALADLLEQVDTAYAAVASQTAEADAIRRLADTVAGRVPNTMKMDLETFVLAAELEEIVAAANVRLAEMSSGRYTLLHTDARAARGGASGLGIEVLDAHTGRARPPQSLSGGETFLASLALALGLAEVVTARAGGIRLDTLFIDEGFGSLDAETLELAMRTLDQLRAGGRAVGVISHVEAMQEQLTARVHVTATGQGPSVIVQESAVTV